MSRRNTIAPLLFLLGCGSSGKDSGLSPEQMCAGEGRTEVVLGTGAGGGFVPIEEDQVLQPASAPQGGVGVPVRGQTRGLVADDAVSVQLETFLDGVLSASFTNDSVQLFCQEDGTGLFFDQVVGLDPSTYPDIASLTALADQPIELVVTVTDSDGDKAKGSITVRIDVGN